MTPRHLLQPESSPPLDNGEEFVSPAATTASNSPLLVRNLSPEWSSFGDMHSNSAQDDLSQPIDMNGRASDAYFEHFNFSSSTTTSASGNVNGSDEMDGQPELFDTDEDQEFLPVDTGGMSFGMFQATIMSARRSSFQKRSY